MFPWWCRNAWKYRSNGDVTRGWRRQHAINVLAALLLVGILHCGQAHAQTINPTGRDLVLETPLSLNGSSLGSVLTTIGAADEISLAADDLLRLLETRGSESLTALVRDNERDGLVTFDSLRPSGIEASFDLASLSVAIEAPADLLGTQRIRVRDPRRRSRSNVDPARYSGYFNLRTFATRAAREGEDRPRLQANGGLDASVRLIEPVLMLGLDLVEDTTDLDRRTALVKRRFTRLTTDLPEIESQMAFGDVDIRGGNFSGATSVLGVSVDREFSLSAGRNINPTGQRSFSIARPSRITVLSEGQRLRTFELPAGNYSLSDVPLIAGANNLELLIEDDTGRRDIVDFSTFFTSDLLAPGELDFAVSVGILSSLQDGSVQYDRDEPAAGAFVRFGASQILTLSGNVQASKLAGIGDVEALLATPFGALSASAAGSQTAQGEPSWAAALEVAGNGRSAFGWSIGAEFRDAGFVSSLRELENETQQQPSLDRYSGFLSVSRRLIRGLSLGTTASYVREGDGAEVLRASATLAQSAGITRGASWALRATHERTDEQESNNLTLSLDYQFSRQNRFTSLFDHSDESAQIGIARQVNAGLVGGYDLQLRADHQLERQQANSLNLGYTGNRFDLQLGHNTLFPLDDDGPRLDVTTVRLGTSLVFAGNTSAMARPINNSFAIIDKHSNLGQRRLRISPSERGDVAYSDWLGPAVITDLGLYNTRIVNYEVDDLPLGYNLGDGAFFVSPPLNSGYDLKVGSAAVVTVIGVLIDQVSSEPISLISGRAIPDDIPGVDEVEFFTNRKGKFALSGAAQGDYVIELNTTPVRRFTLSIPADSTTLYRVGEIPVP